ncbi:Beta-galactosidase [Streptococcus oralis]|uniref:Beta-galactosidase n=1 Tax=Streptococcus oralis TaxID=1303 RepID=A0A139QCD3_STROR|nr:Beta-galactosidase [Streptococcus oralis]
MEKANWNRKRVYSIRKFAVGACSVMVGTCAVLFGGSVIGESPVFADETPIVHTVEQAKEGSPAVEEKENQAVAEHKDAASVDQSQAAPIEASKPEKKEDEPVAPKEEKASLKPEETAPKVESQASSQEKLVKEDLKAATNEEVNQMKK